MGYVGNQQTEGFSQVPAKQDLTGATGTSLTLTHAVASAEGIDLFINNVRQEPTTAYSVGGDGVTVTLTGSVVATDDIYVVYNSLARQTSTHPSNQALQATSGTFSGAVSSASASVTGDLTVDTNTLYVDSTNNRVGVGTTNTSVFNPFAANVIIGGGTTNAGITVYSGSASTGNINFADGTTGYDLYQGYINYDHSNNKMGFYVNYAGSGSPRMSIDSSGNVLVGGTSLTQDDHAHFESNGVLVIRRASGNGRSGIAFYNGATNCGNIILNTTSTAYNTSSDYRLKENVTADWDATTRLKQLNPVRFNFIADADTTVDGFLAHEVQDVVPEAISGTKDAVDDEGNPVYQGIDQSKLVPLLVKTIQELEARITALEAN